jgi:hypothetical protein
MPEDGGLTVSEAVAAFEADGYTGQFVSRPGGRLLCVQCGEEHDADDLQLDRFERVEGESDPADMAVVVAISCPCGARGTAVLKFGPDASTEEIDVLRKLEGRRLL